MGKTRRTLLRAAVLALAACGGSGVEDSPGTGADDAAPGAQPAPRPVQAAPVDDPAGREGAPVPTVQPLPPAPTAVRFAALGDAGRGGDAQSAVGAAVARKCRTSGCDFVLMLGDNIYDSGVSSADDPQFQTKFEEPYAAVDAPFWVVLGNHDYGGGGLGNQFEKGAFQIAYTQRSAKWRMPAAHYRVTQGDVDLFALDTNMQLFGRDTAQRADVKRWLAASTATWKIAFGHHPYRSNGPHGNAGSYDGLAYVPFANGEGVRTFADEVTCGNVDLYLSGHDHSRQWLQEPCRGTSLVVSGTGASGTTLPGANPVHFQSTELGFVYVVVEGRALTVEMVHASGTIEYARTLRK